MTRPAARPPATGWMQYSPKAVAAVPNTDDAKAIACLLKEGGLDVVLAQFLFAATDYGWGSWEADLRDLNDGAVLTPSGAVVKAPLSTAAVSLASTALGTAVGQVRRAGRRIAARLLAASAEEGGRSEPAAERGDPHVSFRDARSAALSDALPSWMIGTFRHHMRTELVLCSYSLSDRHAVLLGGVLAQTRRLRRLVLQHNRDIGDAGAAAIAAALHDSAEPVLEDLHLAYCGVGDEGAVALASALATNRSLQLLHLAGNSVTDTGADAIANAVRRNPRSCLGELMLGDNQLSQECVTRLAFASHKSMFAPKRVQAPTQ